MHDDPATQPIAPPLQPCCRGLDERRARPPPLRGGGKKRPVSGRRRINGHAMEPRALIGSDASRPTPHTIRTPAVRQSKSKAELRQ